MFLLLSLSLMTISVDGVCRFLLQPMEEVIAYCDVASTEDYASISSLDPQTTQLILNISGSFNDSLVSFKHLHQLRTLKFESSTRYSSYEVAGLEHATSIFTRVDLFEQMGNLEEIRINIVLIGSNTRLLNIYQSCAFLICHTLK